jgi:hypothetical protein
MNFINDILRHIKLIKKNLTFDENEKKFLQSSNNKTFEKKKNILIQIVDDYYYLAYYKTIIEDKKFSKYNFVGLWPFFQRPIRKRNFFLEFLFEIYYKLFNLVLFLKWKKLYTSIGVNVFEKLDDNLIFFVKANNIKKKYLFSKNSLLNFKIKNLVIGDLLYDTYLRFRAQPTLFFKDFFFLKLVLKTYLVFNKLNKLHNKYKFKIFFTKYSSYIHHGLPVRFFLSKNVNVYSGKNNTQYNKKLSIKNFKHTENYKEFYSLRKYFSGKSDLINFSKKELNYRFSGKNNNLRIREDLGVNPYQIIKLNRSIKYNFEGVLFLQDFYDSPHDWGNLVFDDYYIWTVFTLNLIRKYKLKVAVKPHPNSWHNSKDSVLIYKRLQNRYSDIIWLDQNLSNKLIFKNIKFGISATGSVLFELAYHNIKAISCGDHPGIDFNYTVHARNRDEYKKILLNINNIKKPDYSKKDLLIYNYIYNHYNMDAFDNVARKINLKKIDFKTSKGLTEFSQNYDNFIKKDNS